MEPDLDILNIKLNAFYNDKTLMEKFKQTSEGLNKEIKEIMAERNITEFEGEQYKAKITIQKRENFNENKLLDILEKYQIENPGLIVLKPVVDMDKLEDCIYNGRINASELEPAREIKEVVTLKVTERK